MVAKAKNPELRAKPGDCLCGCIRPSCLEAFEQLSEIFCGKFDSQSHMTTLPLEAWKQWHNQLEVSGRYLKP
jgi:hypothetical protein